MEPWREAVWRAVPAGATPERFAVRRAFLLEHVRAGDRVLDLGAGDGSFAAELGAAGCDVVAVDVAEEALRRGGGRGGGRGAPPPRGGGARPPPGGGGGRGPGRAGGGGGAAAPPPPPPGPGPA